MRKNFGVKSWLYPMPVLLIGTYNEDDSANLMTAAWGGICDYDKIAIALSKHKSTENILRNKKFSVSIGTKEMVASCDYVGLVSGEKENDKVSKAGFTLIKGEFDSPLFNELPFSLECEFISFDNEILIAKILNVSCDEAYLDDNGNPSMELIKPIIYNTFSHEYHIPGEKVGDAFKCGKEIK